MKVSLSAGAPNIKPLVAAALRASKHTVDSLEAAKGNPTVATEYHKALGRVEALEAVEAALTGNNMLLKMLGD